MLSAMSRQHHDTRSRTFSRVDKGTQRRLELETHSYGPTEKPTVFCGPCDQPLEIELTTRAALSI